MKLDKDYLASQFKDVSALLTWIDGCRSFGSEEKELLRFFVSKNDIENNSFPAVLTLLMLFYLDLQGLCHLNFDYWEGKSFPERHELLISKGLLKVEEVIHFSNKTTWMSYLSSVPDLLDKRNLDGKAPHSLFVLDKSGLYLKRSYDYKQRLIKEIKQRITNQGESVEEDKQKLAVEWSKEKKFFILSGGPGTGKTHTVFNMVVEKFTKFIGKEEQLKIKLLAPTGKAVQRLRESFEESLSSSSGANGIEKGERSKLVKELVKEVAMGTSTIHRFLKSDDRKVSWHNGTVFLYDLVVVDESSMLSLELLTELLSFLPETCQVVLVGDKNQLPPVGADFIFSDLFSAKKDFDLKNHIVLLKKNYRFTAMSEIGKLASAITDSSNDSVDLSEYKEYDELNRNSRLDGEVSFCYNYEEATVKEFWVREYLPFYKDWFSLVKKSQVKLNDKIELFKKLASQMVLCSHRSGVMGVEWLNLKVEEWLVENKLIKTSSLGRGKGASFYAGLPIMITENDYDLGLFNGDVGVVINSSDGRGLTVLFENKSSELPCEELSRFEHYYATSIHKSQGSEYDRVMVLFPNQKNLGESLELLSRELFYTSLTRAKVRVDFFMEREYQKYFFLEKDRKSSLFC